MDKNILTIEHRLEKKELFQSIKLLLFLLFIFSFFIFPAMFLWHSVNGVYPSVWADQQQTHLPQINHYLAHPFNLFHWSAKSATFPGYHLFLAYISLLLGIKHVVQSTWIIRIVNAFFSYGFLIISWNLIWKLCKNARTTFVLIFPIACSYYVISSSIWISTDNGAIFFYVLLLSTLLQKKPSIIVSMISTFFMVFWRQIYFPVIGTFWLSIFFSKEKISALHFAAIVSMPAFILVIFFIWNWGGFTPATAIYPSKFVFLNPTLLLHTLALSGLLVIPYLFFFYSKKQTMYHGWVAIIPALLIAVVLWMVSPSTFYDSNQGKAGRSGSIVWNIAHLTSFLSVGEKSFAVLILAILGAFILSSMVVRAMRLRYYPTELVMLLCYFLGYSCQEYPFQRYLEPLLFITYAIHGARLKPMANWYSFGPVLYLFYACIALSSFSAWRLI